MSGTVFYTENTLNGKIYIGQTQTKCNYYKGSGCNIRKAIKQFGSKSFIRINLMTNINNQEELNYWEDYFINLYNSTNPEIGYNIQKRGSNRGRLHTEEAKNKIKARSNQEDNKRRIREIQRLAANSRIGTHHSDESKIQGAKTKFGKMREIMIYTKNGDLVNSCNFSPEASKLTGVKRAAISNNLAGLSKSAGNYIFKYKE